MLSEYLFERSGIEKMKHKLFIDMDGVLTDLDKELLKTGKISPEDFQKIKDKTMEGMVFWRIVNESGLKFWSEMEWTANGEKLWNMVSKYDPTILSAYDKKGIYSYEGKKIWIRKNLNNVRSILCFREEKQEYARNGYVLIDDREDNIAEWEQRGGIGILYCDKDFDSIKNKIEKHLI